MKTIDVVLALVGRIDANVASYKRGEKTRADFAGHVYEVFQTAQAIGVFSEMVAAMIKGGVLTRDDSGGPDRYPMQLVGRVSGF